MWFTTKVCLYIYTEAKSDDDLIFNKFFSPQAKVERSVSRHNFSCSISVNITAHLIADMSLLVVISAWNVNPKEKMDTVASFLVSSHWKKEKLINSQDFLSKSVFLKNFDIIWLLLLLLGS